MENDIIKFIRQKDYKFIKNIGRGATGATVLLKDELIDQLFICKKYQPIMGIDPKQYYDKFVNEIKLLYLVNNRNIVRVFNYYLYPEQATGYILMEYVDGQSISDYISWSPEKIDDLFMQTIQGFISLEESGILHRDIRESNILVSSDGTLKIIDLGFGKQIKFDSDFDKSISLNWWCDTPNEFMKKIYDFKTEIYFVGKLFEKEIMDNGIEDFSYISELKKMITLDPAERISSFTEIYTSLLSQEMEELFDSDEIDVYREFADNFDKMLAKISSDAKYNNDIDSIISKLDDCYHKNMLEQYIQNNDELARIFVPGAFTYYKKKNIYVYTLKSFLKLIKGSSKDKKRIILSNIQNRLTSIEHYKENTDFTDDIPF